MSDSPLLLDAARETLAEAVSAAGAREVYVRLGKATAVVLDAEKYERLLDRVEDLEDRLSVHEAGGSVPFVPKYAQRV